METRHLGDVKILAIFAPFFFFFWRRWGYRELCQPPDFSLLWSQWMELKAKCVQRGPCISGTDKQKERR